MILLHTSWLYITLPWLYFTLLDSTLVYLYFTLDFSTLALLDSTNFYHGSTSLNLTLQISTMALLHATWLYISLSYIWLYFTVLDSTLLYHHDGSSASNPFRMVRSRIRILWIPFQIFRIWIRLLRIPFYIIVQSCVRMLRIPLEWLEFAFEFLESHCKDSNLHSNASNLVWRVHICIGTLQIFFEWLEFAFECFEFLSNFSNLELNASNGLSLHSNTSNPFRMLRICIRETFLSRLEFGF